MLSHGYLPSQKGYYHGGDLEGLRRRLPYLHHLGITAIWVGPIYANQTVQSDTTDLYGHSAGYHGYWILDFPAGRPAPRHERGVRPPGRRCPQARHQGVHGHRHQPHRRRHPLDGNDGYRNTRDDPYTDVAGNPFDDRQYAYEGQPDYDFPEVDITSFPYTPEVPDSPLKNPAWLNDPLLYHNRGDTSFTGENSLYGDFFGLDDLWTERREVVEGMVDIYSWWIEEFGVDGFRIDTTKHVNMEFWKVFGPDILAAADAGHRRVLRLRRGVRPAVRPPFMSEFSTEGAPVDDRLRLPGGGPRLRLREPADRRPARLLRLGRLLHRRRQQRLCPAHVPGQPRHGADRALPAGRRRRTAAPIRRRAAGQVTAGARPHVLLPGPARRLLRRRTGVHRDGGDKDAREDMFANTVVESYADNDLIGTDETTWTTTSTATIRCTGPSDLARLDDRHPALQGGARSTATHRRPGGYVLADRPRRTHRVRRRPQQQRGGRHRAFPTFSAGHARYDLVARSPGGGGEDLDPQRATAS